MASETTPAAAEQVNLTRTLRRVIVALLLAVALYFGIAVYTGLRSLGTRLYDFAWWTFLAALGLALGNYLLRFLKWQYYLRVLRIEGVPPFDSFLTFVSGFVLSVTPGKVGEVFKSVVLWQVYGIEAARTAPIVVAERLTDLIGVLVIIAIGCTRFPGGLLWAVAGAVMVSSLLLVVATRPLATFFLDLAARMPGPIGRMAPKLREAYESLYVLTSPKHLPVPTLLSTVAWFLECLALWVVLRGFGHASTVLGASFAYATSTLAGALVPVPGGLGVTETVMHTLMRNVCGVDKTDATGAMLLVRFATLWFAVLVGFVGLGILRRRHARLLAS